MVQCIPTSLYDHHELDVVMNLGLIKSSVTNITANIVNFKILFRV